MKKFYPNITKLDIENSSICNAACPQCLRETYPGDYGWFNQTFLSVDFFDRIPDEVYANLRYISLCGTMGDPCAAPNFIDLVKKVRSKAPNAMIKISTNGGIKNASFWSELATVLGDNHEVMFAIDGLSDTNYIYRKNVSWSKLMQNSEAFINAGGNAGWQYIIFKHNQHQVDEAEAFSKIKGFKSFVLKPSHRFALDNILGRVPIGSNGIVIEPPTDERFRHSVVMKPLKKMNVQEWLATSEQTPIECYAKQDQSVYIDSLGNIYPCCFLGSGIYSREGLTIVDGWDELWDNEGKSKVNLYKTEWNDIIDNMFFTKIEESWNKETYAQGKLAICSANCGNFDGRLNNPNEL